jgi:hypothetical protein
MKTVYEIAWNFLNDLSKDEITSSKVRNLVDITGLEINEINLLSEKVEIISFLSSVGWLSTTTGRRLSLVKQVIEEIEQGKPHWEIDMNDVDAIDTSV